jgi:hypothetical protein
MRINWLPRFGRRAKKVNLHELPLPDWWDIVTALRGPDFEPSAALKHLFTNRVRYWVSQIFGLEIFPRRCTPTTIEEVHEAGDEAQTILDKRFDDPGLYHYLGHIHCALMVLSRYLTGEKQRECQGLLDLMYISDKGKLRDVWGNRFMQRMHANVQGPR